MNDNTGTQALWPQMIAALAAIDAALGLPQDGCNSTARTISAIHELQQAAQSAEENAYQDILHTHLRDRFAARALPALIEVCIKDERSGKTYAEHCATNAYEMADAMLAARKTPNA